MARITIGESTGPKLPMKIWYLGTLKQFIAKRIQAMFEKATRYAFRYPTIRGFVTTEQLWELPLQSKTAFDLDNVARDINRNLKAQAEESFVDTSRNTAAKSLQEHLDIVVHIINVKKAENAAAASLTAKKAERAKLVEILHVRNQQDLMAKSPAEIQAMIDALG